MEEAENKPVTLGYRIFDNDKIVGEGRIKLSYNIEFGESNNIIKSIRLVSKENL